MKYSIINKSIDYCIDMTKKLKELINLEYDEFNPDYVIVVGGDGTILRAVDKYKHMLDKVVFFGVHFGKLGFLTNYDDSTIDNLVDNINNNNFLIEKQRYLEFYLNGRTGIAVNEIILTRFPKLMKLDIRADFVKIQDFFGNGLCISTALGSTGFNKSLGGAIIDHDLSILQLTEIAGINSTAYKTLMSPLVLSGNKNISIKVPSKVKINYDNNTIITNEECFLKVRLSKKSINFAYNENTNFIKRINKAFIK